jgi:hypothetical protein
LSTFIITKLGVSTAIWVYSIRGILKGVRETNKRCPSGQNPSTKDVISLVIVMVSRMLWRLYGVTNGETGTVAVILWLSAELALVTAMLLAFSRLVNHFYRTEWEDSFEFQIKL